jgi:hypothetical protein
VISLKLKLYSVCGVMYIADICRVINQRAGVVLSVWCTAVCKYCEFLNFNTS